MQLKAYADGAFPQRSVQEGPVQQRIPPNSETVNLENKTWNKVSRKTEKFATFARIETRKLEGWEKKEYYFYTTYC